MHEPKIAIQMAIEKRIAAIIRAFPTFRIMTRSTHRMINMNASEMQSFRAHESILIYLSAKQYPIVPQIIIMMLIADNSFRY